MKYAIGDIHGGSRTFRTLLKRINLRHVDTLYLLGDYIDRGRDSKGVLDIIWQLMTAGYDVQPIRGNHEDMLLRDLTEDHDLFSIYWMKGWGEDTLKSFGVSAVGKLSSHYLTLLDAFPYMVMDDRHVFVHAGLDTTKDDPVNETSKARMLWEASADIDIRKLGGRRLVTGHRICPIRLIESSLRSAHIKLDNGACTNAHPEMGNLVALNLDTMELTTQPWLDGEAFP